MKLRKALLVLLMVAMLVSLFGCGSAGTTSSSAPAVESSKMEATAEAATSASATPAAVAENLPVRYVMPGSGPNNRDAVMAEVNKRMLADGYNLTLTPVYIPWDAWVDKVNIMLSTGEEFELLHIMEDWVGTGVYQGRGALQPLEGVIASSAPGLKDRFDPILWACATVGGSIYSIPAYWRDASGDGEGLITMRKDKLDAAGLQVPTSIDALITTAKALQASWGGSVKPYVFDHSLTRPPVAFHRTYDTWPFYTSLDGLFKVEQNAKAAAYFTTEEFKQDCAIYARMYKEGLIHPDILSLPQDTINKMKGDGDVLAGLMTFGEEGEPGLRKKYKDDKIDVETIILNPEKPFLTNLPLLNSNGVPSSAKHPEAGVMFLDWLYRSAENHALLMYGFEGTHYTKTDATHIDYITDEAGTALYAWDYWMTGYAPYKYETTGTPAFVEQDNKGVWEGASLVTSPVVGFMFNSEPVKMEYNQVQAEYKTSILPIKCGVLSYEEHFGKAMDNMKAAGIDAVVAEYQKQLDAYLAGKK